MDDTTPAGGKKGLFERAKDIIMSPKTEWSVIDGEATTIGGIFTGYVLILAAIGPIATLIGQQAFGIYGFKPPMEFTVATIVITYVMSLVSVYVASLIIDALATSFGGTKKASTRSSSLIRPRPGWRHLRSSRCLASSPFPGSTASTCSTRSAAWLMRVAEDKAIG